MSNMLQPLLILSTIGLLCMEATTKSALGAGDSEVRCPEEERQALLKFKEGLVDDLHLLSSWETQKDCCYFRGIQCSNRTSHVIVIDLSPKTTFKNESRYVNLRGSNVSNSLLDLQYLKFLDLSYIDFQGLHIPEFISSLAELVYLDLSWTRIVGNIPHQLGNLWNLLVLDLSNNNLEGNVPYQLSNLSSLFFLDLANNNLVGSIPNQYGNLSALQVLDLSNDFLYSDNLEWLSHLSSLEYLRMDYVILNKSNNWLQIINSFPSLSHLTLSSCQLPELIPSSLSHINSSTSLAYLDLSNNLFTSSMFSWLFNISTGLAYLDLSYNQLQGPIPDAFGDIMSLQSLHLSSNHLEGGIPRAVGNLCNLRTLALSANNLVGTIDSFMNFSGCNMDTLESLYLDENKFSGHMPDLTRFSSLRAINFASNQLNGSLSEGIRQLSNLEVLVVSSNSFLNETVSDADLLNLSKLSLLDLSSNSLVFDISPSWEPPFQLDHIVLRSCKLGPQFPQWLQTQKDFSFLDVSNTGISDVIPTWFWDLSSRIKYLNLSHNQIHGNLPDQLLKFANYPMLVLSYNNFDGPLPLVPSETVYLDLSNNMFSGSISSICKVTGGFLNYLDLSFNLLSGELPDCWEDLPELVFVALVNCNLTGKIPPSFGSLQKLLSLHLRNNSLYGELPSSMKNCAQLRVIDLGENKLSGRIPAWIGESLPSLMVLRLRSNEFHGSLPVELCHLSSLQILDLSMNNISGIMPQCIYNFSAMVQNSSGLQIGYNVSFSYPGGFGYSAYYLDSIFVAWKQGEFAYYTTLGLVKMIDFSSNNLTGIIPEEITSLFGLISVNLSRNQMGGMIPENFGQMKSLESLDLSRNHLSGEIPPSLSDLHFLSHMELSYNDLSGRIPSSTQLQSFDASAFEGNPDLCGPPLTKECPRDSGPGSGNEDDHEDNGGWFDVLWFYAGTGSGFVVGLLGVCGALIYNSSWRYAYFRFLDNVTDWLYVTLAVYKARLQQIFKANS